MWKREEIKEKRARLSCKQQARHGSIDICGHKQSTCEEE
jgi:hypothetical protein